MEIRILVASTQMFVARKPLSALFVLSLFFLSMTAGATNYRSSAAKSAFRYEHPCPATGKVRGACPGWIVDHIVPLCAGGADAPSNMQWQTVADAKVKDKGEWRTCRHLKRQAVDSSTK